MTTGTSREKVHKASQGAGLASPDRDVTTDGRVTRTTLTRNETLKINLHIYAMTIADCFFFLTVERPLGPADRASLKVKAH